jgi:hypothetical protein
MKTMYHSLREKDRRRYAAVEAAELGRGGIEYIVKLLGCRSRDRNQQFEIRCFYRDPYLDSLNLILSIDTKKREVLGDFFRDEQVLHEPDCRVFDHDFPSFVREECCPINRVAERG